MQKQIKEKYEIIKQQLKYVEPLIAFVDQAPVFGNDVEKKEAYSDQESLFKQALGKTIQTQLEQHAKGLGLVEPMGLQWIDLWREIDSTVYSSLMMGDYMLTATQLGRHMQARWYENDSGMFCYMTLCDLKQSSYEKLPYLKNFQWISNIQVEYMKRNNTEGKISFDFLVCSHEYLMNIKGSKKCGSAWCWEVSLFNKASDSTCLLDKLILNEKLEIKKVYIGCKNVLMHLGKLAQLEVFDSWMTQGSVWEWINGLKGEARELSFENDQWQVQQNMWDYLKEEVNKLGVDLDEFDQVSQSDIRDYDWDLMHEMLLSALGHYPFETNLSAALKSFLQSMRLNARANLINTRLPGSIKKIYNTL